MKAIKTIGYREIRKIVKQAIADQLSRAASEQTDQARPSAAWPFPPGDSERRVNAILEQQKATKLRQEADYRARRADEERQRMLVRHQANFVRQSRLPPRDPVDRNPNGANLDDPDFHQELIEKLILEGKTREQAVMLTSDQNKRRLVADRMRLDY